MTLAERAQLATAARVQRRIEKQRLLRVLLADGECLARAAHKVGWSYRSARRWHKSTI